MISEPVLNQLVHANWKERLAGIEALTEVRFALLGFMACQWKLKGVQNGSGNEAKYSCLVQAGGGGGGGWGGVPFLVPVRWAPLPHWSPPLNLPQYT